MKNFYYKLNHIIFFSLFLSFSSIFALYILKALHFQPKILVWPLIVYSGYFFSVFILTLLTSKLKYIVVNDTSLEVYIGPLWSRKKLNFYWKLVRSIKAFKQKVKEDEVRTQWGSYYATTQRKVISLEFEKKILDSQIKMISTIQKFEIFISRLEVSKKSTEIFVTSEPKGGFDQLIKSISEHMQFE